MEEKIKIYIKKISAIFFLLFLLILLFYLVESILLPLTGDSINFIFNIKPGADWVGYEYVLEQLFFSKVYYFFAFLLFIEICTAFYNRNSQNKKSLNLRKWFYLFSVVLVYSIFLLIPTFFNPLLQLVGINEATFYFLGFLVVPYFFILILLYVNWLLSQFVSASKSKIFIFIFLILVSYFLPRYLNNYYLEKFYTATGNIVTEDISFNGFQYFDANYSTVIEINNLCIKKSPVNCKFVRWVENELAAKNHAISEKGFGMSKDGPTFFVTCYYGCPK